MGNTTIEERSPLDAKLAQLKKFESDLQYLADKTCIGNRPEAEAELVKIRAEIVYLTAQKRKLSSSLRTTTLA